METKINPKNIGRNDFYYFMTFPSKSVIEGEKFAKCT